MAPDTQIRLTLAKAAPAINIGTLLLVGTAQEDATGERLSQRDSS